MPFVFVVALFELAAAFVGKLWLEIAAFLIFLPS